MTALMCESAAPLPVAAFANDAETASRVDLGLRRFLASDAVTVDLYDDLETVLGEDAARLSAEDSMAIVCRLRAVTPTLRYVVARLLRPYPSEMDDVMARSSEFPGPEDAHGHLVRFASSILTVLDLMGDLAELREDASS
ncbi:hypothetical protein ACIQRW_27155 [Streptomyces sp. NPDC091287]|uniref:hypothetical protein n=1 Tax=Streptomyces sp. NPDC091287 TaxID=3365988 RepID=UPI00382BEFF7